MKTKSTGLNVPGHFERRIYFKVLTRPHHKGEKRTESRFGVETGGRNKQRRRLNFTDKKNRLHLCKVF